jgi:hypothetical protein
MDQIHWICPGTWYTLFQLLDWNIWLLQTWGFVHSPSPPDSGWASQVTMIPGAKWLCVGFCSWVWTGWTWVSSGFTLTWWIVYLVDCHGSRVCVLFIWSLLLPWPWHTSLGYFVTHPLHCLAVAWLATALICWNLSPCGLLSSGLPMPILCCPRIWTSTSVLWQCALSKLNLCVILLTVQTELLTLTFWLVLCYLFCRFELWPEDHPQAT